MLTHAAALTSSLDVAQVVLYAFWLFLAALVYYLRREDKREGYPLETEGRPRPRVVVQGFPPVPEPKSFRLADGATVYAPRAEPAARPIAAQPTSPAPGSPLEPTGDPLRDGVGPASYAMRADHPDRTLEGHPKIVPLRAASDFGIAANDPDPRGMEVIAADGASVGRVVDVWIDRSEHLVRYLEVDAAGSPRLVPTSFWRLARGRVMVDAIASTAFAHVPATSRPDSVTLLEEDKIVAYFGGGLLYGTPERLGPLL